MSASRTPWHLWAAGGLSLVWNAFGAFDYFMTQTQNEAYMAAFTPEQLEFFYNFPIWVTAAWAIAVWGSVAGSVLLLLKKSLAVPVFTVSLVCMVVTSFHNFILSDGVAIMGGTGPLIFTIVIFVVAVLLVIYSRKQREAGVLV